MQLGDILKGVTHEIIQGNVNKEIEDIKIDSREIKNRYMFICIEGLTIDSHELIDDAINNGATALLVSKNVKVNLEITVIKVSNTRKAMSIVASNFNHNPDKKMNVIGFTGTNGKTSCAFFMKSVLREFGHNVGLIGTVNTMINDDELPIKFKTSTTPDSLELMKILDIFSKSCTDVCMEVSSHSLLLDKVYGMLFKVGVFTNLSQDHLDTHKTMENYFESKAKLFSQCEYGVINIDDDKALELLKIGTCNFLTYGIENDADLKAIDVKYSPNGVNYKVEIDDIEHEFTINIPGRFTVYNTLSVLGASLCLKIPVEIIKSAFKKIKGVPGRIQSIKNNNNFNVFVDYAHTPDGLLNIISSVREFTKGRIIIVFGCGGNRDKTKRTIMGEIAGKNSDICIITSDNPRNEDPFSILDDISEGIKKTNCKFLKFIDRKEAIYYAINYAEENDSVIIAGKGHESYQVFKDKIIHFDDAEIAKSALEELE